MTNNRKKQIVRKHKHLKCTTSLYCKCLWNDENIIFYSFIDLEKKNNENAYNFVFFIFIRHPLS